MMLPFLTIPSFDFIIVLDLFINIMDQVINIQGSNVYIIHSILFSYYLGTKFRIT